MNIRFFSRIGFSFLLIAFLLAISCKSEPPTPAVYLNVDDEYKKNWNEIIQTCPFPADIEIVSNLNETEKSPIDDSSLDIRAEISFATKGPLEHSAPYYPEPSVLIEKRYYVPATPIWDPRHNINMKLLSKISLVPLDELSLPNKALTVDGRSVGSDDYPLISKTFIQLSYSDSKLPALEKWFDGLTSYFPQAHSFERPKVVTIGAVGDIMVQRGVQDILIRNEEDGLHTIFQNTLPVLQSQDLLIGNLEGAVTYRGTAIPKSFNFRFSPEVLPWLKQAGFDYLSITNNHCYDFGAQGFTDTLKHLQENGLLTSGAGTSPEQAYAPVQVTLKDTKISILSVGAYPQEKNGFNGRQQAHVQEDRPGIIFSGPRVLETIRNNTVPENIDIIVAHGGQEWQAVPSKEQKEFYRSCIDAGAEIVFAHHPHVLQGMEAYNNGVIAYSLGNFIFPGMYVMPHAEESMILSAGFVQGRLVYLTPYPVRINNRVVALDGPDGPILQRFMQLTQQLNQDTLK